MKDVKFYLIALALFGAVITVAIIAAKTPSPQQSELSQQKQLYAQAEADLAAATAEMDTLRTACQTEFDRWSATATAAEARMIEANKTAEAIRLKLASQGTQLPLQDFPKAEK